MASSSYPSRFYRSASDEYELLQSQVGFSQYSFESSSRKTEHREDIRQAEESTRFSTISSETKLHNRQSQLLSRFLRRYPGLTIALLLGAGGSFACFVFAIWLSAQTFECPSWTVNCTVSPAVRSLSARLGLVQGILSTIYNMSIGCITYALYRLAETTVWPILNQKPMTPSSIDRHLSYSRGSLASFSFTLWHTASATHIFVIAIVGLNGLLLHANPTIVGWALTLHSVPTMFQSLHSQGGGEGFGFQQTSPPVPFNGEVERAANMYSAWSNNQSHEVLPDLRGYILDRANFTPIGDFCVGAVRVAPQIRCYGASFPLIDTSGLPETYAVATDLSGTDIDGSIIDNLPVSLRFTATAFTLWVNKTEVLNDTAARTTIMFTALNSTFEGGQTDTIFADYCESVWPTGSCSGTSTLACDVDVNLQQGQACRAGYVPGNNDISNITWLGDGGLQYDGGTADLPQLAVSIAAGCTQFGPFIRGAQPLFELQTSSNGSLSLPVAWVDWEAAGTARNYRQADIINFINVTAGAMAIAMPQGWPRDTILVSSRYDILRLRHSRSYVLIIPPAFALLSVVLLAILCARLYKHCGIEKFHTGATSELIYSWHVGNPSSVVDDEILNAEDPVAALEDKPLRYVRVDDQVMGLRIQHDSSKPTKGVVQTRER